MENSCSTQPYIPTVTPSMSTTSGFFASVRFAPAPKYWSPAPSSTSMVDRSPSTPWSIMWLLASVKAHGFTAFSPAMVEVGASRQGPHLAIGFKVSVRGTSRLNTPKSTPCTNARSSGPTRASPSPAAKTLLFPSVGTKSAPITRRGARPLTDAEHPSFIIIGFPKLSSIAHC